MTRFTAMILAGVAIIATAPAHADGTAKQFMQLVDSEDGRALGETKLVALEEGIRVTNASLGPTAKLYCQPPTLVLTGPQIADMLRRAVAANDKLEDQAVSAVLLGVLETTFPCAAAK
ncbi:MAG TPA: hypothetical protein VHE09_08650 [Rhizomicrobium sp.]|jgi:hypothetical protein|nr:hypothetical protein [Rhizomicrobium sp.]